MGGCCLFGKSITKDELKKLERKLDKEQRVLYALQDIPPISILKRKIGKKSDGKRDKKKCNRNGKGSLILHGK